MTRQTQSSTSHDRKFYAAVTSVDQNDTNSSIRSIHEIYNLAIQKLEKKDYLFIKKHRKVSEVILLTCMPHFPPTVPHKLLQLVHRKLSLLIATLHEENLAVRIRSSEQSLVLNNAEAQVFYPILKRLISNDILIQKESYNSEVYLILKRPMVEVLNDIDHLYL
ncbi:MAG: hypothetical protein CMM39_01845 [Rhodospirillaceae bacterium]|nr:hypothetical protein [Rhodospirillaceae bacterium]|tara:strand:+ start:755 stop:1246 length:492 start_codon:yes stop_codon:yes gene_type:complete